MLKSRTTAKGFDSDLKAILPRLRVYALALTHDRDRADDLVQQTAVKALVGRKSFRPGTNFGGWLFRIQRNEFISGLRRLRPTVCFDDISTNTLSHPPHQESGLVMREFMGAFRHLAPGTRQALLLAAVEGHSYKQIATPAGIFGRHGEKPHLARSRGASADARGQIAGRPILRAANVKDAAKPGSSRSHGRPARP